MRIFKQVTPAKDTVRPKAICLQNRGGVPDGDLAKRKTTNNGSLTVRSVTPEILDSLPPDDPAAQASRRDLRLYNRLMGNFSWFGKQLSRHKQPESIVEPGAGDGGLGLYLKNNDHLHFGSLYMGNDLIGPPPDWPCDWSWNQTDLLALDLNGTYSTLLANLILHQFNDEELARIGEGIGRSSIKRLLINEPSRRRLHLWQIALSRLLGVHPVSLHDARASICAGFRGDELIRILGLQKEDWKIMVSETFMGANRVICDRL